MKILIADDSPVLRMAVTKLLEPEGYTVVAAEDGVEGIEKFYEEKPDLVLLDVQMPKLNGYVVCRLIKEDPTAAGIPVLILTLKTATGAPSRVPMGTSPRKPSVMSCSPLSGRRLPAGLCGNCLVPRLPRRSSSTRQTCSPGCAKF